jgi:Uncharacterized protein conserved in bacteria (DUF2130)
VASFEERVHAAIGRISEARGDCPHHVGDEGGEGGSKKGDTVVEIGAADGKPLGRIVFEDKDDQLSRNRAWEELNAAMAERDADFAVLVVAGEESTSARREQLVSTRQQDDRRRRLRVAGRAGARPRLPLRAAACAGGARPLARGRHSARPGRGQGGSLRPEARPGRAPALTNVDKSSAKAREGIEGIVADVETELARIEALVAAAGWQFRGRTCGVGDAVRRTRGEQESDSLAIGRRGSQGAGSG